MPVKCPRSDCRGGDGRMSGLGIDRVIMSIILSRPGFPKKLVSQFVCIDRLIVDKLRKSESNAFSMFYSPVECEISFFFSTIKKSFLNFEFFLRNSTWSTSVCFRCFIGTYGQQKPNAFWSYLSTRAIKPHCLCFIQKRLKKAGLVSRKVAHLEKSSHVVSVSAFILNYVNYE